MKRLILAPLFALVALLPLRAQNEVPEVSSAIEPDTIRIGDIFTYTIEVKRDLAQSAYFPQFNPKQGEQGVADLEVVEELPVDTLSREGRRLHLRKRYRLQAFEEGTVVIGRAAVLYADKNILDTLYGGDSLLLYIAPIEIDSVAAREGLRPIKAQHDMPFRFGEIGGYVGYGLLALALLALVVYLLLRLLARMGKPVGALFRPTPPLPPHVVAIRALEELHHRKLWQNGNYKLYYSELTDILRTYLAGRYAIGAMEMTSDEILAAVRHLSTDELPQKASMDLTAILHEADLVKFAKAEPAAEENEGAYTKAYYFVEETKIQENEPSEGEGIAHA